MGLLNTVWSVDGEDAMQRQLFSNPELAYRYKDLHTQCFGLELAVEEIHSEYGFNEQGEVWVADAERLHIAYTAFLFPPTKCIIPRESPDLHSPGSFFIGTVFRSLDSLPYGEESLSIEEASDGYISQLTLQSVSREENLALLSFMSQSYALAGQVSDPIFTRCFLEMVSSAADVFNSEVRILIE